MPKRNLRQRIRAALLNEDEKLLNRMGFTYKSGNLTVEGRKVVLDELFKKDTELRNRVLDLANKLEGNITTRS